MLLLSFQSSFSRAKILDYRPRVVCPYKLKAKYLNSHLVAESGGQPSRLAGQKWQLNFSSNFKWDFVFMTVAATAAVNKNALEPPMKSDEEEGLAVTSKSTTKCSFREKNVRKFCTSRVAGRNEKNKAENYLLKLTIFSEVVSWQDDSVRMCCVFGPTNQKSRWSKTVA